MFYQYLKASKSKKEKDVKELLNHCCSHALCAWTQSFRDKPQQLWIPQSITKLKYSAKLKILSIRNSVQCSLQVDQGISFSKRKSSSIMELHYSVMES